MSAGVGQAQEPSWNEALGPSVWLGEVWSIPRAHLQLPFHPGLYLPFALVTKSQLQGAH